METEYTVVKIVKNQQGNHETNKKIESFTNYDAAKAYVNDALGDIAKNWAYHENVEFYRVSGVNHNRYYAGLEQKDHAIDVCFIICPEKVVEEDDD